MVDKKEKGEFEEIKVEDKRRFNSDGAVRDGVKDEPPPRKSAEDASKEKNKEGNDIHDFDNVPDVDFSTFLLSLATSVQIHMGIIANPASGKIENNLAMARQTIDVLDILKKKTEGNLDDAERRLLEHLLFDLKMQFVEKNKKSS